MIANPVLQWVFTAAFLAVAAHCAAGVVRSAARPRPGSGRAAAGHLLHLVMSLDMAAMVWPWWAQIPLAPQLVTFSLAAAWFAVPALRTALVRRREVHRPVAAQSLINATMMLAMVWMVAVMGGAAQDSAGAVAAAAPGASMPGHQHGTLPPVHVAVGLGLTVLMLAAAACFATRVAGSGGATTHRRAAATANVTMTAGMAAMCWLMIST